MEGTLLPSHQLPNATGLNFLMQTVQKCHATSLNISKNILPSSSIKNLEIWYCIINFKVTDACKIFFQNCIKLSE